ncbi:MAG TPA: HD domain-containing protein [Candidatus Rifleibacterium sp.]|nr:HD domain-containing protein [Candidatus Rifleibacterium sp.]HPT47793.1 HD domain-containing protein [Candidatus Rifleibacterium sp.]
MNQQQTERLKNSFTEYVNSFRDAEGQLHAMLQLKLDHSQRVAEEARAIAADLSWSDAEITMAEIAGLYHDVGRFSQFRDFQTYYDPKSVNHGCRGFQVLSRSDWLVGLSESETRVVLESVRLHNCHTLPEDLSADLRRFVNLIRDADKLDIFFVLSDAIEEQALREKPGIIWNLPRDIPPGQVILDDLRNQRQARYENVKSQADFCLLQLCWIYDLNYLPTIKKVAERGIVDRIVKTLPESEELHDAVRHLQGFLKQAVSA